MEKTLAKEKVSGQHGPSVVQRETDWQSVLSGLQLTPGDGQRIICTEPCAAAIMLAQELARARARVAQLEQMHFGRSSEKGATVLGGPGKPEAASNEEDTTSPVSPPAEPSQAPHAKAGEESQCQAAPKHDADADPPKFPERIVRFTKKRGAKPGHRGYGRHIPKNLAEEHIIIRVPDEQRVCPRTGKEGEPLPPTFWETSRQIDIVLMAVLKVYHREKLKFDCDGCPAETRAQCPVALASRTAPPSHGVENEDASITTEPEVTQAVDKDDIRPVPDAEMLHNVNDSEAAPNQPSAGTTTGGMPQGGRKVTFVTASQPPQAVNKSMLTTGSVAFIIFLKYFLALPLTRISTLLNNACGFKLGPSTMISSFKHHKDLFEALYRRMVEEVRNFGHINIDETSWRSFFRRIGKATYLDWMWVMASEKVVLYVLDKSRSSKVLLKYLGTAVHGVVSADRAQAYKKFAKEVQGVLLSFCWAHFRRDFVKAAVGNALLRPWAKCWIGRILKIYRLNRQRLKVLGDPVAFPKAQAKLEAAIKDFFDKIQAELRESNLYAAQREVLESAVRHWHGLTLFVTDPLIPLDNNRAERLLRIVALARKNYYGTYAEWSGEFTAYCLTIIQTAIMHGLEPMAYIKYYLDACAKAGGVPKDLEPLLPWNIPEDVRRQYGMSPQELDRCA